MAIDTTEKRYNIVGVGRPYLRTQFPQTTPDEEWRVAIGNAYSGNALSSGGAAINQLLLLTAGQHGAANVLGGGMR